MKIKLEENDSENKKISKKFIILIIIIIILGVIGSFANIKYQESKEKEYKEERNECKSNVSNRTSGKNSVYTDIIPSESDMKKPIIYIYPEEETEIEIKLGNEELLTCTYPKYENGWKVNAKEDGTLIDENGRTYYALYWEGINPNRNGIKLEEGFVVKGEDTINFLEEKLEMLGLNEIEAEEFIVYWLPQMQNNEYNYIRFQTIEEINKNMPLSIEPKPDTLIRIMMEWKSLDKYIEVKEQKLTKAERKGYTVVEWGGTNISGKFYE